MIQRLTSIEFLLIGLFMMLTCAIYANIIHAPFYFDDQPNIVNDYGIRMTSLSWDAIVQVANRSAHRDRFIPNLTFALNYYIDGYQTTGYHLVNIFIHLLTGWVLYLFARCILFYSLKNNYINLAAGVESQYFKYIPIFVAGIWLVHPVHVEAVTYIVQRMTSLAALGYMSALVCYIYGRSQAKRATAVKFYTACGSMALMAFASKPNTVTLPFYLLLIEWAFFQNLSGAWIAKYRRYFLGLMLVVVVAVFISKFDWAQFILDSYKPFDFTLKQRLLTELRILLFYIGLLIWPNPHRLNLDYDYPLSFSLVDPLSTLIALIVLVGLVVWACCRLKKHFLPAFAIIWYLGQLAIESSFIGLDLVFEHRLYLPSMIPILVAVFFIFKWCRRVACSTTVLLIVVIGLSIWTYQRNQVWKNPVSLWSDCVTKSPHKARTYNNLGNALLDQGQVSQAIAVFRQGLGIKPADKQLHLNLGIALSRSGKPVKAFNHFQRALALDPTDANVYYNLGKLSELQGKAFKSQQYYLTAIRYSPNHKAALTNFANQLLNSDHLIQAIGLYQRVLRFDPTYRPARVNLTYAYARESDLNRRIAALNTSLPKTPDNPQKWYQLAQLYFQKEELDRVVDSCRKGLAMQPNSLNTLALLSKAYASQGRYEAAVTVSNRIIGLDPANADAYYFLASVYSRWGKVDQALMGLKSAIDNGFNNLAAIKEDPNLQNIRSSARYQRLIEKLSETKHRITG